MFFGGSLGRPLGSSHPFARVFPQNGSDHLDRVHFALRRAEGDGSSWLAFRVAHQLALYVLIL